MWKITRAVGETILIDGDIQVTLLGVQGTQVQFGIVGPDRKLGGLGQAGKEANARHCRPLISGIVLDKE